MDTIKTTTEYGKTEYVKETNNFTSQKEEMRMVTSNGLGRIDLKAANQRLAEIQKNGTTSNERIKGIVLLKNYSKGETGNGNPKFSGIISNKEEMDFQIWSNKKAYEYLDSVRPVSGETVVNIDAEFSKFGLVINDMEVIEGCNPEEFIDYRYDIHETVKNFCNLIRSSGISEKALDVIKMILHMGENDEISNRICREYAAYRYHDNCRSGLLAHMTKCIKIYNGVKDCYDFLSDQRTNDLMVIALAIHDVGKIFEMYNGTYQKMSFIKHQGLGYEHALQYKDKIVVLYDEEFFYMLCSVLLQHHGEFGEPPKTLYAVLAHMIDNLDATLTSFDEVMRAELFIIDESGTKIKAGLDENNNTKYLNILSPIEE